MDDTTEDYSQDLLDYYKMFIAPYTQGTSYRLIKYTDTTMNEESTNYYVDSEIGLLRVGELMAGQFDTINNNTEYWLLNSTDSSVYNVETDGRLYTAAPANAIYGIKPALFIRPYAVITGGTGTKTDPFTIKRS